MDTLTTLLIRDVCEAATSLALGQTEALQVRLTMALSRVAPHVNEDDTEMDSPLAGDGEEDRIASAECLSEALLALTMRDRPSRVFLLLLEALNWSHVGRAQRTAREWLVLYRLRVR